MKKQNLCFLLVRLIAVSFILSCLILTAYADTSSVKNVQITLSSEDAGRFERTFGSIARQANIALVIEGGPLKNSLTPQQVLEVRKNTALPTLLETLCKQYDYELVTGRNGGIPYNDVLILQKKYTNAADVPGVTNGECRAALQDVERLMTMNGTVGNIQRTREEKSSMACLTPFHRSKRGNYHQEFLFLHYRPCRSAVYIV